MYYFSNSIRGHNRHFKPIVSVMMVNINIVELHCSYDMSQPSKTRL